MNFFDAKVQRANGKLIVDAGSFQVPIPEKSMDIYGPYENKNVVFGIRPEDIHDPAYAPPSIEAASVGVKVDVTELMGNEIFVYLEAGDDVFVGRVDPRTTFTMGQEVQVAFNMDNMHLFETEGLKNAIR
jgi:multiple sugar transport system ATP-binding protein